MNREQLAETLGRLVREGTITQGDAALLLEAYDRGEISEEDLPLTGDEARQDITEELVLALLLALARLLPETEDAAVAIQQELESSTTLQRQRLYEDARDDYEERMAEATKAYKDGDITMREWHAEMRDAVVAFGVTAAIIARGGPLTAEERGALQADTDQQMGFLRRYADTAAVKEALDDIEDSEEVALSEGQMQNRSSQYAYLGIAAFWTATADEQDDGMIARYISQDDGGTCSPCLEADFGGPYLPENVPTPGVVCVANGRCRCVVEYEFAPEVAATL